jgi:hypothetical protein
MLPYAEAVKQLSCFIDYADREGCHISNDDRKAFATLRRAGKVMEKVEGATLTPMSDGCGDGMTGLSAVAILRESLAYKETK